MVKYCPVCHHPNYDCNENCMNCGFNFKASPFVKEEIPTNEEEKPPRFTLKDFIAIIVVSALIVGLLILLYERPS